MISIVIPTYKHLSDCLKPCLESIFKYTEMSNKEIIVVANGCDDETEKYLCELKDKIRFVWFKEGIGFTRAINNGIKVASGEYIILLNNDTILLNQEKDKWINILKEPFLRDEKMAVTGPKMLRENNVNEDFLIFCCVMIKKSIFDEIGLLDERFNPGGMEDTDFCIRAQKAGYKIEAYKSVYLIFHKAEATMPDLGNWSKIFYENTKKLVKKYSKVGIVMPAYNSCLYIEKTIKSIQAQTFTNWQLVVVDDCSSDNTMEIVKNISKDDDRIYFTKTEKNSGGPAIPRNIALEYLKPLADITHIAYCDADDIWYESHLEDSLNILAEENDFVYSEVDLEFDNGEKAFRKNIQNPQKFNIDNLAKGNYIYISSVVHKKECLSVGEFDSELNSIEDWDYWLRIAKANYKMAYTNELAGTYVIRKDGVASKNNKEIQRIFSEKHKINTNKKKEGKMIKLNLGCGNDIKEGYVNIDLYSEKADKKCDIKYLPYENDSVDEILALHVIEHFDMKEGIEVLKEWYRVLKPNGKLVLETPDMEYSCKWFLEADKEWRIKLYGHFFAWPWMKGQQHKFLYTETQLFECLKEVGFQETKRVAPSSIYVVPGKEDAYLKVETYKKEKSSLNYRPMEGEPVRLNIGCGDDIKEGFINCDLYSPNADAKMDVRHLSFGNDIADEIYAGHIIEHFDFKEGFEVLKEWYRVLKPNGKLVLETPDMEYSCFKFVNSDEQEKIALYSHIFSSGWIPGQAHLFLYTENQLKWTLGQVGFKNIQRVKADSHYVKERNDEKLFLKVICVK